MKITKRELKQMINEAVVSAMRKTRRPLNEGSRECVTETDICYTDERIFGDDDEHWYDVDCYDGYAIAHKQNGESGPDTLRITYPTRSEIIRDKRKAYAVLSCRGLDDLSPRDITFGDIMLCYGDIVR